MSNKILYADRKNDIIKGQRVRKRGCGSWQKDIGTLMVGVACNMGNSLCI